MSDRKLLIILIVVITIQCIVTLTHPAYRYYKSQAENLRTDYLRFEKQVRDDFVPAITNLALKVPRGTYTKNEITENEITENEISKNVITNSVISFPDKPPYTEIFGSPFSQNDKIGFYCNGFYYFVGDTFMGSKILSIDGFGFLLSNGYVRFTKDEITKDVITKDVITKDVNDNIFVPQCPDVFYYD